MDSEWKCLFESGGLGLNKWVCICLFDCLFKDGDVELVGNVTEEVQILRNRVQLLEQVIHTSTCIHSVPFGS